MDGREGEMVEVGGREGEGMEKGIKKGSVGVRGSSARGGGSEPTGDSRVPVPSPGIVSPTPEGARKREEAVLAEWAPLVGFLERLEREEVVKSSAAREERKRRVGQLLSTQGGLQCYTLGLERRDCRLTRS